MSLTVEIRRNADGAIRTHADSGPWDDANEYGWTEGNFSCDCNRALFFARAVGDPDPNIPCGDDGYSIRVSGADGRVLYQDSDWEPETQKKGRPVSGAA